MAYRQAPVTTAFEYQVNTADYGGDITITVDGSLGTGEYIEVRCPGSGSASDVDLYLDGTKMELTPTNGMVRISGSAILLISKGTTAAVVGFRIA